ncbi:MAG: AEC family transporter [Acetobacteraceae bacterium]|nr:AEC family transporter [Acetobacteraceae bacterium]
MVNLTVLVLCFALGILLRRTGRLPADAHKTINAFIVNVALPALILRHVHALHLDGGLLLPAAMPWLLFAASAAFFLLLGRAAGWSRRTTGGLILSGGLANTSFVGLPMIEAFYGPAFLGVGILADQLGSYMALSTAGILVAALCAESGPVSPAALARKVASFPPFQALVLALLLLPVNYPEPLTAVLDRLGATLTPLALVSVGSQLRLGDLRGHLPSLSAGLLYKLVLGPGLVAGFFILGLHAGGKVVQVTIFEAAMGPMIGGSIVAMDHGLDPRLVGLMVGVGIPLSLATAAAWCYLLTGV